MALSRSRVIGFPTEALVLAATLAGTAASHAAVTISTAATSNMSCASGVCTPTARNAVLNVSQLESMLSSSSVTVNTAGALASVIDVKAALTWTSANGLTLDAYQSITVEKPVADNGTASLTLLTDDGGTGGVLSFTSKGSISFLGTSNALTINGHAYALVSNITTLASDIAANPSGLYAFAGNYNAAADGTYSQSPVPTTFEGTLEGLGNAISNLSISSNQEYLGLFATMDTPSTVRDLLLTNISIAGSGRIVGGLAGSSAGTAYGDVVTGTIETREEHASAGGLMGQGGNTTNCSSSAAVTATGKGAFAGGLVGGAGGSITNSFATGAVRIKAGNTDLVEGMAGGLIGYYGGGTISGSFATGRVSGGKSSSVGGLVGFLTYPSGGGTQIANSYALGDVTGTRSSRAGGLIGWNAISPGHGAVSDSYSTGIVKGDTVGGLIGYDDNIGTGGCHCFTDLYWDTTTSKITNLDQGAGNLRYDPGLAGKTSRHLKSKLPAGFDPTIWAESPSINKGLPYLIANPPQ
jgi:GLUG motif-containing protein